MEIELSNDLEWSDEDDSEEKYVMKLTDQSTKDTDYFVSSELIVDQSDLIEPDYKLYDHKRSYFSGNVKLKSMADATEMIATKRNEATFKKTKSYSFPFQLVIALPKIPALTYQVIEKDVVLLLWYEFLKHGSDESELLKVSQLVSVDKEMTKQLGYNLPFDSITCTSQLDDDDYVEFTDVLRDLVHLVQNKPVVCEETTVSATLSSDFPLPCCTFASCKHRPAQQNKRNLLLTTDSKENDDNIDSELWDGSLLFRLNIIYKQIQHDNNGKIRIKHIFNICNELGIKYNKHQLPETILMNQTECLLTSQQEVIKLIDIIRVEDTDIDRNPEGLFKFVLPNWLREEFKGSEILLYEHHFTLIDVDGGGSIDVNELQQLLAGFGTKVTLEEAQSMLDEYDMDGGGTIDFVEFMVLIYKIQRGTIDLKNNELGQALVEAKAQLKIFEEIEEVKRHPPPHCEVIHFGNTPVTALFRITGPSDCDTYRDVQVVLQLIFYDGYPYRPPDIKVMNRIFHVNIITQLDGGGRFLHLKDMWSADWTIHKLLVHISDLLYSPDLSLLPEEFREIFNGWKEKLFGEILLKSSKYREDLAVYNNALEKHKQISSNSGDISSNSSNRDAKHDSVNDSKQHNHNSSSSTVEHTLYSKSHNSITSSDSKYYEHPTSDTKQHITNESKGFDHKIFTPCTTMHSTNSNHSEAKDSHRTIVGTDCLQLKELIPADYLPSNLTIALLTTEEVQKKIDQLSRIEQMHLSTLFTFLTDKRKYAAVVRQFSEKYKYDVDVVGH